MELQHKLIEITKRFTDKDIEMHSHFIDDLEHGLKRAIITDIKEQFDCSIFLCDLGDDSSKSLEELCKEYHNCSYKYFGAETPFAEYVVENYKR